MTPDMTTHPDGTESFSLAQWEQELLEGQITMGRQRIAAARKQGIRKVMRGSDSWYADAHGAQMIPNTLYTAWYPKTDCCQSCGSNMEHVETYGHLLSCPERTQKVTDTKGLVYGGISVIR